MLTEINLLPWRKTQQFIQQKNQRLLLLIGIGTVFVITLFATLTLNHCIFIAKAEQTNLTKQSIALDVILQKQQQAEQMTRLIATMTKEEEQWITTLAALQNALPAEMYFTDIRHTQHQLQLIGQTPTMGSLKQFIHTVKSTIKLQQVDIVNIEHLPSRTAIHFHLTLLEAP